MKLSPEFEKKEANILFNRAADLIEKGGLAKGSYHDGTRFCIVGAIREVAEMRYGILLHVSKIFDTIGERAFDKVTKWNDNSRRTQKQVVALLRKLARA